MMNSSIFWFIGRSTEADIMMPCRELGCWEWSWEDANKHSRDALERARVEIERWRFALQKLLIRSNRYLKTKRPVMCCLIEPAHRSIPNSQHRKCVVALIQAPLRTRKYKNSIRFAKRPSFFLKDDICYFSNESRTLYTTSVVKISVFCHRHEPLGRLVR